MLNRAWQESDKKYIRTLIDQIKSSVKDDEVYRGILCDFILHGQSMQHSDVAHSALSEISKSLSFDGEYKANVKEMLYEELYLSWKKVHLVNPRLPTEKRPAAEILVWGFEMRLKQAQAVEIKCDLKKLSPEQLRAFWATIQISQLHFIKGISNFTMQTEEAWRISCEGLAGSSLTKFIFDEHGPIYFQTISVAMWVTFWQSVKTSGITDLTLDFAYLPDDNYWDIMCEGIKMSKLKAINLTRMSLYNAGLSQWVKLYNALKLIEAESLDLSCNQLHSLFTANEPDSDLTPADIICAIISMPSLRKLTLMQEGFEKASDYGWSKLCHALAISNLEQLEIDISRDGALSLNNWLLFLKIPMDLPLKSLVLRHYSVNELTADIVTVICEMIKLSSLTSVSVAHFFGFLSLANHQWKILAETFKKKGIKSFDFGTISLTRENFIAFCENILLCGINTLNFQRFYLNQLPNDLWATFHTRAKEGKIKILDVRQDRSMYGNAQAWSDFCNMVIQSGIKELYVDLERNDRITLDEMKIFCNAIQNGQLETLVMDFFDVFSLSRDRFELLFSSINRSKITSLPCPPIPEDLRKEKREILENTLRIIKNRAEYKNTLLGMCAMTLFTKGNAILTDTSVTYSVNKAPHKQIVSQPIMDILRKFA